MGLSEKLICGELFFVRIPVLFLVKICVWLPRNGRKSEEKAIENFVFVN